MKKFLFTDLARLQRLIDSRDHDKWLYIDQFCLEAKLIAHKLEIANQEEKKFQFLVYNLRKYVVIRIEKIDEIKNSDYLMRAKKHFSAIAGMSDRLQYPELAEFIYARQIAFCADLMHMMELHINKDQDLARFYFDVRDVLTKALTKLRAVPDVVYSKGAVSERNAILYSFKPLSRISCALQGADQAPEKIVSKVQLR